MRILTKATPILTAGLAFTASAAAADVTALDVWESWKSMAEGYAQTISVDSETYSGGVLTLSGVTSSMDLPEGSAEGTLSELILTEEGDGTVSLTMPGDYPFSFSSAGPEGEEVTMAMRFQQSGLTLVASGDPGAIDYAFSAPSMTVVLDEFTEDGTPIDMTINLVMSGTEGTYSVTEGTPQNIVSDFTAGTLTFEMSMAEPEEDVDFQMSLNMADVVSTSVGSISPFSGGRDLAALLREGLSTQGTVTTGASDYAVSINDGENPFTLNGSAESGHLDVDLGSDGIRYAGGNAGVVAELNIQSMPLPPLTLALAQSEGELRMPLIATEEAKDFGLKLNLTDLAMGDTVWGMVDPSGSLPRDPANLQLDIAGVGKWIVDISDPEAMSDPAALGGMPGEVETVSLNSLLLSIVGAELTGSGDFQFNNESFMPLPSGVVDLKLVGGNGVIDKLVAAGLVPEDQAMGARMMLGLFARPAEGADTLVSTIELKEDGSVLANGQRIR